MATVYSIEYNGRTICDGFDRMQVIENATDYFQDQREEDGFVGAWEEEVTLSIYNDETGEEKEESITLSGEAEAYVCPRKEHGTY